MDKQIAKTILEELQAKRWAAAIMLHRENCPWKDLCPVSETNFEGEAQCLIAQLQVIAEVKDYQLLQIMAEELKTWCTENQYRIFQKP